MVTWVRETTEPAELQLLTDEAGLKPMIPDHKSLKAAELVVLLMQ